MSRGSHTDVRLRAGERELAANPGDPLAWVRLSQDYQRAGRRLEAVEVAARAIRLHPTNPELRERLGELGCAEGPWSQERGGPGNQNRCELPGPDEGIQRWRAELPRQPVGAPLIDREGRIYLRAEPAGLMRVSPDGRDVTLVAEDWRSHVRPLLFGGEPTGFDPALCDLSCPPREGGVDLWSAVRSPGDGCLFGLGPDQVRCVSRDGETLWKTDMPRTHQPSRPVELAVGLEGPVYVALGAREWEFRPDSNPGRVWALDRESGQFLWQHGPSQPTPRAGVLSVGVAPQGLLLAQLGRELICEDATGRALWRCGVEAAAAPAIGRDVVVSTSPREGAVAFDLRSGAQRWQAPGLRTSIPAVLDGRGHTYLLHPHPEWLAALGPDGALAFQLPLTGLGPPGPLALGYDRTAFFTAGRQLVAVR